jgi:DNA-binding response OmpR family regulator
MKALFVMDPSLALSLGQALAGDGIVIDVAPKASEADSRVRAEAYAAVLVDPERLGGPGFARLRRWRRAGFKGHILVLLSRDCDSADRVKCLDAGADGYLDQPLCVKELQARFRAWGRRDPILRAHDLEIDTDSRRARRGGQVIDLTPSEFDVLRLLAQCQGRVVTRPTILEALYNGQKSNHSNIVDVYIRCLRGKIDRGFERPLILTRRGQGYMLRGARG